MDDNEHLAELSDRIGARFDALSPQLGKAARYLLANPDDVALCSMRELAKRAQLPPVTFVRLARALAFDDYAGLRDVFQNRLRDTGRPQHYSAKARDLQLRDGQVDTGAWIAEFFAAERANIEHTGDRIDVTDMGTAAAFIETAKQTYVLGQRSCHAPAFLFHYIYRLFRSNSTLLDNRGGTAFDELRHADRDDLVVVISIAPYTAEVVRIARYAREQGAHVLALTDDALSPIARCADAYLLAATQTPSFFHSITALVGLIQALLALVVMRGGDTTLAQIECAETQLARYGAYWPDDSQPRKT